jgi:hypothetical protein
LKFLKVALFAAEDLLADFRLVAPSFLAGAAMTLTSFFVLFKVLTKLFFSIDKLLEDWIVGPAVICLDSRLGSMHHRSPLGEPQVTRFLIDHHEGGKWWWLEYPK